MRDRGHKIRIQGWTRGGRPRTLRAPVLDLRHGGRGGGLAAKAGREGRRERAYKEAKDGERLGSVAPHCLTHATWFFKIRRSGPTGVTMEGVFHLSLMAPCG